MPIAAGFVGCSDWPGGGIERNRLPDDSAYTQVEGALEKRPVLSHHIFMRAEYRGFVYNSPTYDLTALSGLDRVTHRAEPSIGLGYRF
jgi:hypothetical protein